MAILLDEYLVPAIDKICLALKLPTEVAGATLVAIGSALPDILATTIGQFLSICEKSFPCMSSNFANFAHV